VGLNKIDEFLARDKFFKNLRHEINYLEILEIIFEKASPLVILPKHSALY